MNAKTQTNTKELFGHPVGLYILFFTEMWERFSYYGMRAILVLYIIAEAKDGPTGGLGWSNEDALALYGWYTMMVYLMSIPGGLLADRYLGQKKAVMLGGLLLCVGHGILAIEALWAFYTGLVLIVFGVGCLKPNISTMVGGLYKQGDIRRDKGFTIFYIGINVGAFLSSIIVGAIGEKVGWHYGFGLAGIGMLLGQLVFVYGQKYLKGVGEVVKERVDTAKRMVDEKKGLTKIEKDRVVVLLLSFLIIIVFWGAFEQAGGLMNIYAKEKINRVFMGVEIPASVFQSVNAFFIMVFGTTVAAFWVRRRVKGKEESAIFKMAIGTIIMGTGFLMMGAASVEAGAEPFGDAAMYWLILAYLLHTIGELCTSPVSLSFITKLAPVKYASLMMGLYFAATGLGNKVAGLIGEASQSKPIKMEILADQAFLESISEKEVVQKDVFSEVIIDLLGDLVPKEGPSERTNFEVRVNVYNDAQGKFVIHTLSGNEPLNARITMDKENTEHLQEELADEEVTESNKYHAKLAIEKKKGKYEGQIVIDEIQNDRELITFLSIFGITVFFGIVLLARLKKLKAMTHGAEDVKSAEELAKEAIESEVA
ncbi:peptide MFS transporter [Rapidithrix thailandica]|uniref:Peptide MFS transporter n=1 Tax=Rapidithrix thailandica TaxID=413964 RepID=A0AAW9SCH3_9BACT